MPLVRRRRTTRGRDRRRATVQADSGSGRLGTYPAGWMGTGPPGQVARWHVDTGRRPARAGKDARTAAHLTTCARNCESLTVMQWTGLAEQPWRFGPVDTAGRQSARRRARASPDRVPLGFRLPHLAGTGGAHLDGDLADLRVWSGQAQMGGLVTEPDVALRLGFGDPALAGVVVLGTRVIAREDHGGGSGVCGVAVVDIDAFAVGEAA